MVAEITVCTRKRAIGWFQCASRQNAFVALIKSVILARNWTAVI